MVGGWWIKKMDGWMVDKKQMNGGWTEEIDGSVEKMDEWLDGWIEKIDRWLDGWLDGQKKIDV